ncbi:hypothetical protein LJR225_000249 [Phenylobacterium sp. LjRoot225]|uniref:hypothetical protein n=1 Tax=Phenylobacterium sp. LjRoot225 TaxID=3342285 RepID=UPI003ECDAC50
MPRWDDPRGPRHDPERDRWRRDQIRDRGRSGGEERRAFGDSGRHGPARFDARNDDPEPGGYGRPYEDAGAAGYAPRRGDRPSAGLYGDQDYSQESEGGFGGGASSGPDWGIDPDSERRRNFDLDDPGVGQSQAGYGQRSQTHPDHDFDPDYLRWRDAQLRSHDREYQEWRRDQHRQYDEEYRRFRSERQRHFGQAFHEWRSQRSAADVGAAPGVGAYGDKAAASGGEHPRNDEAPRDGARTKDEPPRH